MRINTPNLIIEINETKYIFIVLNNDEDENLKIISKTTVPVEGMSGNKIFDQNLIIKILKDNIYSLEKKLNYTFKEVILLIDNFDCSFINLSGFNKLNGSQLVKENISYIINNLKTKINEIEINKIILHIFNTKYLLDNKESENLPIGLFGNFYSHELSFFLINNNDYKNIKNIFNNCNLKIEKIISKNFIEGIKLTNEHSDLVSFFKIDMNNNKTKIIFFRNSSPIYFQNFNFGSELILKDISKVTGLSIDVVKAALINLDFSKTGLEKEEFLEKKYFLESNYRKISKQLIFNIANARVEEILEIILFKNINALSFFEKKIPVFLHLNDELIYKSFAKAFTSFFFKKNILEIKFIKKEVSNNFYFNLFKIVQFGWKREAVPIIQKKRSLIAKFFNYLFN